MIKKTGTGIKWGAKAYNAVNNWVSELSPVTKIVIGTAAIIFATVVTGGTATVPVLTAAFKAAAVGATMGGIIGGVSGYIDGGWKGALKGALGGAIEGGSTGFMFGAVGGATKEITKFANSALQARKTAPIAQSSPATGKSCFVAGTLILTEDAHKPIEEIQVGDEVYSYNPVTGEKGLKPVVNTFVHDKDTLLNVYVGELKIETTEEHPFWVVGKGWVLAGELEVGNQLLLQSGEILAITELEWVHLETPVKVYNFEVRDWHTYFVSELDVLVHNKAMKIDRKYEVGAYKDIRGAEGLDAHHVG